MIWEIIKFELKYRSHRPVTYIYFFLLLGFSFLLAGFADIRVNELEGHIYRNAPEVITILTLILMMVGAFIASAVMGVPVYRDYDHNFYEIIYATKVKKWEYLWGRFLGSYLVSIIIFSGILFGLMLGFAINWQDEDSIGPFNLAAYLNPFFLYLIPNLFILGSLFFIIGSYFKSQVAISLQGIFFVFLYFLVSIIAEKFEVGPLKAMLDPFGFAAESYTTKHWVSGEKSTLLVPISNVIIANRLLWISIALALSIVFIRIFKINPSTFTKKKKEKAYIDVYTDQVSDISKSMIPEYKFQTRFLQWWSLTKFYFVSIIRSIPFFVLIFCGIGFVLLVEYGNSLLGIPYIPVTFLKIEEIINGFMLFAIIIIIIYSGELVWKEISNKFSILLDSSPISDKTLVLSKFCAIILIELLLLLIIALTAIVLQIFKGFYDFQPGVSLKMLMFNTFPGLFLQTMLFFLIHTLVSNKYLGHTIVIFIMVFKIISNRVGINHILFRYGKSLTESYSGMNGLKKFIFPTLFVDLYWLMPGIVFLCLSIWLIKRGSDYSLKNRFGNLLQQWKYGKTKYIIIFAMLLFFALGSGIFYNTNTLNTFRTKKQEIIFKAAYEKKFSKYKNAHQARITDVKVQVDIFPEEAAFQAKGTYRLINKSEQKIDTIHLRLNPSIRFKKVEFDKISKSVDIDEEYGYYLHVLNQSLKPGDTINFEFEVEYKERGFSNEGRDKIIIPNGTFFSNDLLPYFGYDESFVLVKKSDRKKAGLEEKVFEAPSLFDTTAYNNNFINHNANKINYEAIISTSLDQFAITTGKMVKEWSENNRHYYHYKSEEPQWNAYPFVSAEYEVFSDKINGIDIKIYYHKDDAYNLEKMISAIKKTMEYCELNFYPYQLDEIKLIEIPRYFDFAQSFNGILLLAENMIFVADVDKKNDIDLAFYFTSMEIAKQWWGQKIAPADAKGKLFLTESLAEYTALMVMEKEYGANNMQKFLKFEQDRYNRNKDAEKIKEVPLYLTSDEKYLAINKGGVVLYAMKDYIGEENLNVAFQCYIQEYIQNTPPYPTSLNLLNQIEKVTPDSLSYLVNDMFRSTVSFSNKIDSCYYTKRQDGWFDVSIYVRCGKFISDSINKQIEVQPSDWIDLGIYARSAEKKDSLVYLKKKFFDSKNTEIHLTLKNLPYKAGIDPFYKLMDQDLNDNINEIKALR